MDKPMPKHVQQDLRAMLAAKRLMDEAWAHYQQTRRDYDKAQSAFLGHYPRCSPPGPIICGTTFLEIKHGWERADEEIKFDYTEAERVPTSD